jgi:hypothetical protein
MFNPKILKKMKKEMDASKDMESMSKYAMGSMKPEKENKGEDEGKEKMKGASPNAKVEIELMLYEAKKSKGKK